MCEWKQYKLGDIFNIQNGYAFKSGEFVDYSDDTYEVLKIGHIEVGGGLRSDPKRTFVNRNSKYLKWVLERNDIVMGMTDMKSNVVILGIPALIDKSDKYVLNQRVARLSLKDSQSFDIHFCYYQMLWNVFISELRKTANSGVQVNLTTPGISNSLLFVPDIETQNKIGDILRILDDKIAVNHRICENLEAQAQAIFKHWFIDFVPFKEGKFVDSELGMIPEGWRVGTLIEIADYMNGLAMQKFPPLFEDDAIPVLKIKELGQSKCDKNSDKCSKQIKSEYIIKDGDVVFSWSGTLLVDIWCGGICGLNQHLFKVTSNNYPKWFYLMWTKHHLAEFVRIAKDKAVTMGHIKRGDLEKAQVAIPDSNTLYEMSEVMNVIFDQIINSRLESNALSTLRDTLLPKLMSGQIKVNEIEKSL